MSHAPPSHPSTAHANTVPISRPLRILLVAALAVAALGASRTPAHAARGMEVALQDDSSFVSQIGLKRKKALAFAATLHVTRLRVNIPWVAVVNKAHSSRRPKKRHYDFTSYDALFNKARAKGIRLQLTISGFAPAWATGNGQVGCYRMKLKYFKEFAHAVAKHFGHHIELQGLERPAQRRREHVPQDVCGRL